MTALDLLGRQVRDLRISVTDRCNMRCTYCMPRESFADHSFLPRASLLTFEEIARVARAFSSLGTRKIRLTGGEPLLRRDLPRLVSMLSGIEGIEDLALTTNGALLDDATVTALAGAGLRRITISLDALDDSIFRRITDSAFPVQRVLDAVAAVERSTLRPLKIDTVIRRGLNESQILPLARHFRGTPHVLRFIEFMDVGTTNGWRESDVVPAREILKIVSGEWPLEPLPASTPGEVAQRWRYIDGEGEIGLIASVTQPFCGACTRARISADGSIWLCLFASRGHDLRPRLRDGSDDATLRDELLRVWSARDDRYSEIRSGNSHTGSQRIEMSRIGG